MPVKLFDQASALARAGRPKDAVALIENAAAAGDSLIAEIISKVGS